LDGDFVPVSYLGTVLLLIDSTEFP